MPTDDPCEVCDGPLAQAVDTLLYLGRDFDQVRKQLGQPYSFEDAVRRHVYGKHVKSADHKTYQMMIVIYQQDIRRLLEREMKRPLKEQNNQRIDTCHRGIRWSIEQVAKVEGLYQNELTPYRARVGKSGNELLEALNTFAEANPDAAKRVREATRREKPVLIEAQPEPIKSPVQKGRDDAA